MRKRRYWTAPENALLRKHYPTLGPNAVAEMLDRGSNSVRQRAYHMRIANRPRQTIPEYIIREILWAYAEKGSCAGIALASAIGVSKSRLEHLARKRGIKVTRPHQGRPSDARWRRAMRVGLVLA